MSPESQQPDARPNARRVAIRDSSGIDTDWIDSGRSEVLDDDALKQEA